MPALLSAERKATVPWLWLPAAVVVLMLGQDAPATFPVSEVSEASLTETDPIETPAASDALHQRPSFGIADLMVLIASMAIAFSFRNQLNSIGWRIETKVLWFQAIFYACSCLCTALPLAALYRFWVQKKVTGRFLVEPGHWILWTSLITMLGWAISVAMIYRLQRGSGSSIDGASAVFYFAPQAIFSLIAIGILIRGAIQFRGAWRALLTILALENLATACQMVLFASIFVFEFSGGRRAIFLDGMQWVTAGFEILIVIGLLTILVIELRKGPRRDLWHWMGVFEMFIYSGVFPVLNWFYTRYFLDPSLPF